MHQMHPSFRLAPVVLFMCTSASSLIGALAGVFAVQLLSSNRSALLMLPVMPVLLCIAVAQYWFMRCIGFSIGAIMAMTLAASLGCSLAAMTAVSPMQSLWYGAAWFACSMAPAALSGARATLTKRREV